MNLSKYSENMHTEADKGITADIILSLLILMTTGAYYYGYRAIIVTIICVSCALITEYIINIILKNYEFTYDLCTVIYSIITAFFMPATVPLWLPAVSGVITVLIKCGMQFKDGYRFTNPFIAASAITNLFFIRFMNNPPQPFSKLELISAEATSVTEAPHTFMNMFLGKTAGNIGTTCIFLIIICGSYLVWRKIILWKAPVCYIAVCTLLGAVLQHGFDGLFMDGMVMTAVYGLSNFGTDTRDTVSQIIYALICAFVTVVLYYFAGFGGAAVCSVFAADTVIFICDLIHRRRNCSRM